MPHVISFYDNLGGGGGQILQGVIVLFFVSFHTNLVSADSGIYAISKEFGRGGGWEGGYLTNYCGNGR